MASGVQIADTQSNDIYLSVTMRMFTTRPNQNGVAVTEAFIDQIAVNAEKYRCIPLCADTSKLKSGDLKHLGHMLDKRTGTFLTEQIGAFSSFEKVQDEYGVSLIGEARIAKRNKKVCSAIQALFDTGQLNFSFEIQAVEVTAANGVTTIDAAEGNELIGMAVVSLPAYPEATALALVAEIEEDNRQGAMLEHTSFEIAETDFETIRHWFFQALRCALQDQLWNYRIERIGIDFAILYDVNAGKTMKVEFVAGDEGVALTDAYEVVYQRKEEGVGNMAETNKDMKQAAEPVADQSAELAAKDARIAELEGKVSALESVAAELDALKAEAETLRAEKEVAVLEAKHKELLQFAEAHGLDLNTDAVK